MSNVWTQITAAGILDGVSNNLLQRGKVCFSGPVNQAGGAVPAITTVGPLTSRTVTFLVVNGAITTRSDGQPAVVADTANTNPKNIGYTVTILDEDDNEIQGPGYLCVQPTGATWSLDSYAPPQPSLGLIALGPQGLQGVPGNPGLTRPLFPSLFTVQGYVNASGALVPDVNWKTTASLLPSDLAAMICGLYGNPNVSSVAAYSAAGAFLGGLTAPADGQFLYAPFALPANTATVTLTMRDPNGAVPSAPAASQFVFQLPSTASVASIPLVPYGLITGYLASANGALVVDPNWLTTPGLPLAALDLISCILPGHPAAYSLSLWTASGTLVAGFSAPAPGTPPYQATVAASYYPTAAYFRLSFQNPAAVPGTVNAAVQYQAPANTGTAAAVAAALPAVTGLPVTSSLIAQCTLVGYIDPSGNLQADANWLSSPALPCSPGDKISALAGGVVAMCNVTYYNGATRLAGFGSSAPVAAVYAGKSTAPAGTTAVRLSINNPATNPYTYRGAPLVSTIARLSPAAQASLSVQTLEETADGFDLLYAATRKLRLMSTNKIFLAGDSRSSTDYPWYKQWMAALTGAQVNNGGWSGATAAQIASNAYTGRIWAYNPDLIVALIGGNDTGAAGTVGTLTGMVPGEATVAQVSVAGDYTGTAFVQAIDFFIRKVFAQYYNIRARAGLTGSETEAVKNTMIAAVTPKPVLYVCTDLPQQRNSATDPTAQPANWLRKRAAILEACAVNGVQCIDLYTLLPFAANMAAEPFYPGPASVNGTTNTTNNQGVYFMDGLHPNQFGAELLAQAISRAIGL